ncbi:hypothetical protein [Thermithiobacillus plumbiphilus]|uniref:Uncharacterized protein n=1 Tax=Thermithiobacillus plumbiphilus TaxID=1729899 RepID=A0ABU9D7I5_9PROT
MQARENQPAGRIQDPVPEPAFEPGPALGLLDGDPLPELPRKRPRRHFQHWGLLMITMLLTLAALAAGGYYATLFEKASGTQAQSSALDEHRTEASAAKQKAVKHEEARQIVSVNKPVSRLASQELKKSPRPKPYSAPRANPASRVASSPKPEPAARVASSPAAQPSAMALEEHDPLYLHRKEQELDLLLRQLQ